MSEPTIYVIPEAYWGGKAPKQRSSPRTTSTAIAPLTAVPAPKRLSTKAIFLIVVGVLFVTTVAGAVWYFTRPLRQPPVITPQPQPFPETPAPPVETTPVAVEPSLPSPPTPIPPPTVRAPDDDPDRDGLTEAEEVLYETKSTMPDTDADGYLDGHEVFNLYNPSGTAPEKIEPAGLVQRYGVEDLEVEIYHPTSWVVNPEAGGRVVVFQAGDGESITLTAVENLENISFDAWIASHEPNAAGTPWTSNKYGLAGSRINEGVIYLSAGSNIIVLRYEPSADTFRYRQTLEMMANSLRLRE